MLVTLTFLDKDNVTGGRSTIIGFAATAKAKRIVDKNDVGNMARSKWVETWTHRVVREDLYKLAPGDGPCGWLFG